ncbi:phosphotyrosine protein phosphatase [Collibacillus ludicampi]|uniref:protein-tyrosine-phosphatase n=1 Tax=Collibacillus ludicampi TaxID=2771369 RepID=A0AAV4L9R0_9BACL|nr:low molecular weight protein-tyrosine-phosphatase [Collibacillus ludicampi]GIM44483.1 phosphotyrosine protein phosphatase [Collibacillus ludicampi]
MVRVLFVCLGNICRSPMAEAVFRNLVKTEGLAEEIEIDSAGISGWHAGERPHYGTIQVLSKHGISHDGIYSRQIQKNDLQTFDYIVAMDEENIEGLRKLGVSKGKVFRLLDLVDNSLTKNVPDPYYTGNFDQVYDLIERGCEALLRKIKEEHCL